MDCGNYGYIWRIDRSSSLLSSSTRIGSSIHCFINLGRNVKFFGFPISAILGWYDAYKYLMMDDNEFDRKYNSNNFRDRYGNRRSEPKVQEVRRGKYILMDEDKITTQGRAGYFDLIKTKSKVKV